MRRIRPEMSEEKSAVKRRNSTTGPRMPEKTSSKKPKTPSKKLKKNQKTS
jgi:hypothetical protein